MKKIVAFLLALALTAVLAACGTKNDTPAQEQEPVQQEQNTEPEMQQEQQGAAIDYTGAYQDRVSQRATMTVTQDGENLSFEVSWSNSAFETNEWTMSGKLSEDGTRVDYTDGRMVTTSFGEPGELPGEEATPVDVLVVYENGTGHFDIADGVFTWVSNNDDFAENPVFERIP